MYKRQQRFGTADRRELRKIVFSDPAARKDLEAILHPLIQAESLVRLHAAANSSRFDPPVLAYEAALLVETGRYRDFEGLIVVDASRDTRRQRLIARDGLDPQLADAILASQASDEERRAVATHLIDNSGNLTDLRGRVNEVISRITKTV